MEIWFRANSWFQFYNLYVWYVIRLMDQNQLWGCLLSECTEAPTNSAIGPTVRTSSMPFDNKARQIGFHHYYSMTFSNMAPRMLVFPTWKASKGTERRAVPPAYPIVTSRYAPARKELSPHNARRIVLATHYLTPFISVCLNPLK